MKRKKTICFLIVLFFFISNGFCFAVKKWEKGIVYDRKQKIVFEGVEYECLYRTKANSLYSPKEFPVFWKKTITSSLPEKQDTKDNKLVVYYPNWSYYNKFMPDDLEPAASAITHINYSFVNVLIRDNEVFFEYTDIQKDRILIEEFKKFKLKHPHIKILVSIGGWTLSEYFSQIAASEDYRKQFAQKAVALISKAHKQQDGSIVAPDFDGIDIDWEFPVSGGAPNMKYDKNDKDNFVALLLETRRELDKCRDCKDKLLTFAGPPSYLRIENFDLKKLNNIVDWVNIMAYDYHVASEQYNNFNAPLFPYPVKSSKDSKDIEQQARKYNVAYTIFSYLKAGMSRDKIVCGIPFYGRSMTNFMFDSKNKDGLFGIGDIDDPYARRGPSSRYIRPATNSDMAKELDGKGIVSYSDINEPDKDNKVRVTTRVLTGKWGENVFATRKQYNYKWNDYAKIPYLYTDGNNPDNISSNVFISYDNQRSIVEKVKYIKDKNLAGVMIWDITLDDKKNNFPLIFSISETFKGKQVSKIKPESSFAKAANDFIDGSSLNLSTAYYRRGRYGEDPATKKYVFDYGIKHESLQTVLDFSSGYFNNFIGFDLVGYGSTFISTNDKQSEHAKYSERIRHLDETGEESELTSIGTIALKTKFGTPDFNFGLKIGHLPIRAGIIAPNSATIFESSYRGFEMHSNIYNKLKLSYGFAKSMQSTWSENQHQFETRTGKYDNALVRSIYTYYPIDCIYSIGVKYSFTHDFSTEIAYGEASDFMKRYFAKIEKKFNINDNTDFFVNAQYYAAQGDGHIWETIVPDNTSFKIKDRWPFWSDSRAHHEVLETRLNINSWSFFLGYNQTIAKHKALDEIRRVGQFIPRFTRDFGNSQGRFDDIVIADGLSDFLYDGERVIGVGIDYSFKKDLFAGLNLGFKYILGTNITSRDEAGAIFASDGSESSLIYKIGYTFQKRFIKGLTLSYRHINYRLKKPSDDQIEDWMFSPKYSTRDDVFTIIYRKAIF